MNAASLKRKYNLLLEQYDKIRGTHCPLCRKRYSRTRLACVDHDHASGLVRGVLCSQCNDKIGWLHEDGGWLTRAANYLDRPPALGVIGMVFVPGSVGAADPRHVAGGAR